MSRRGDRSGQCEARYLPGEPDGKPMTCVTGDSSGRLETRVLQIIDRVEKCKGTSLYVGQQVDIGNPRKK